MHVDNSDERLLLLFIVTLLRNEAKVVFILSSCINMDSFMLLLCICFNRNVDLREYLTEEAQATEKNTTYDLVANIVHDGKPTEGAYRIHVLHHVGHRQIFLKWV